ncbi:MAG: GNAT family N-acetyltransferase [Bdellovibrio sp.]|nr:MAG: GNAT family N-acetyltransferase [Bdellovibrio sp.]
MHMRPAKLDDAAEIWKVMEPIIRAGETYALPRDMSQDEALAYWMNSKQETFVATDGNELLGTYFLRANHSGGGNHIANCGYMIAQTAQGRGVGRQMCEHSIERAQSLGYRGMQFNFVVSTNERAVHLWQFMGFEIVGRLPQVFRHPSRGFVDAFVMFRSLL